MTFINSYAHVTFICYLQVGLVYLSIVLAASPLPLQGRTVVPGCGRLLTLDNPVTLSTVIQRVKRHLNLSLVRLAVGNGAGLDKAVQTVAICAGSGREVLHVLGIPFYGIIPYLLYM